MFATNQRLLERALGDLSDHDFRRRATEHTNSTAWVVGHILQTRASMLARLSDPLDTGWGAMFARGAEPPDASAYPDQEAMLAMSHRVAEQLTVRLLALTADELAADAQGSPLPGVTIVAEQLGFFALHDSYHVGQLGFIRKALGHPPLVG
jgi:uncharacterized damage-inducible protein DinB